MDLALGRCKRMWAFALSAILVGGLLIALPLASPEAKAHGSLSDPPSRTYTCRFIAPEDPMCQQAWDADPQALYDWMEVNIGDAASRHQELIPDGRLCSANRDKYAAFDTANSQWRATPLTADADGKYTFTWESTAPHATRYYKLYLTNASYDPNQPLAWDDLELVYDSGDRPGEFEAELRTELPDRTGHHILYTVWQRSDSPEAFYSCSDVLLGGATTPTPTPSVSPSATVTSSPTPTPIEPTPTSPTATPHPTHTPPNPDTDNADLKLVTTADWGSGYCAEGKVTTTSTAPVSWEVSFDLHGEMTSAWSADITMGADHRYRATGHSWNATVKKGSPTSFGFCMDHGSHNPPAPTPTQTPTVTPSPTPSATATPTPTVSDTPTPTPTVPPTSGPLQARFEVTSDWGSGFGANVEIKNTSNKAVTPWELSFTLPAGVSVSGLWNGMLASDGQVQTVTPAAWNSTIAPGQKIEVGFNGANSSGSAFPGLVTCSINGHTCEGEDSVPPVEPTPSPSETPTMTADPSPPTVTPSPTITPSTSASPSETPTVTPDPTPPTAGEGRRIGYFTQWGIYARNYFVKDIAASGSASKLTHLNYAFGNISPQGECYIVNQSGAGDAWADFGRSFTAGQSVDGIADSWSQNLRGNFNQLKELKAQNPHLKALISLGGWTWSKRFSDVALTQESREKFVSSCVDLYLKGNLPVIDGAGGEGAAAGVFDGIDLDWEYPGSEGLSGNAVRPEDTENYTLLLQEFRKQLDALTAATGDPYELTAAMPAGQSKTAKYEIPEVAEALDFLNIMSYDFRGAWDASGPTNFHSNLHVDPNGPGVGEVKTASVESAVAAWLDGGAPADKIVVGVPFYGRGWSGVAPGSGNGLYQSATGAAPGTYEAGFEDYKVLVNRPGTTFRDPVTKQMWSYDGNVFWSFDDPEVIREKMRFINERGLGGAMVWSLDGDTTDGELMSEIDAHLG